jgi:hypothetical protein
MKHSESGALLLIVIIGLLAYWLFNRDKSKSLGESLQNIWNGPAGYVPPNDPSRLNNPSDPTLNIGGCN